MKQRAQSPTVAGPVSISLDDLAVSGGASSVSDIGPDYIAESKEDDSGNAQQSRADAGKTIIDASGKVTLVPPKHIVTNNPG